jgi:hypothetical protein
MKNMAQNIDKFLLTKSVPHARLGHRFSPAGEPVDPASLAFARSGFRFLVVPPAISKTPDKFVGRFAYRVPPRGIEPRITA